MLLVMTIIVRQFADIFVVENNTLIRKIFETHMQKVLRRLQASPKMRGSLEMSPPTDSRNLIVLLTGAVEWNYARGQSVASGEAGDTERYYCDKCAHGQIVHQSSSSSFDGR
jgi:hypothetical protein